MKKINKKKFYPNSEEYQNLEDDIVKEETIIYVAGRPRGSIVSPYSEDKMFYADPFPMTVWTSTS